MFQVIARTDAEVTVIFLQPHPAAGHVATWSTQDYRNIGVNVSEFMPDAGWTPYITGEMVPVRPSHAKCHNFEGGWNGFGFYTDSKGQLYAVRNAR